MNPSPAFQPGRPARHKAALVITPLLASLLAGCGALDGVLSSDKVDYKSAVVKAQPLEVPPDLTQLSRDSRYTAQGGVISASSAAGNTATPSLPAAGSTVALLSKGDVRVERQGSQRWLVTSLTPEQLWPQVKAFWGERGFALAMENAEAGVMETEWAQNRAKLPNDPIRNTIGRVLGSLYDTGERDLFRTRIERTASGSEIYISHRGLEEVYTSERKDSTEWRPRASDTELEAEFLSRLMARLGVPEAGARTAVAAAPQAPARARVLGAAADAALEVDEPFDRAWRRVGLALDRGGFTVEDRDRGAGVYFVRYVDPKVGQQAEPGFFSKLFGGAKETERGAQRYRVALKAAGEKTDIRVLNSAGDATTGETGQRIASQLVAELR